MKDYDVDLEPKEHKFKLKGKEYTLHEPSEDATRRWNNHRAKHLRVVDGKFGGATEGMYDSRSQLIADCCVDAGGKAVPVAVVRTWPSRITEELYELAVAMGELNGKPAKNEATPAEATSA